MSQFDLLTAVQPSTGWFAIVGIKEHENPAARVRQWFVETRAEVDEVVQRFVAQNRNVFFGVAKYENDQSRLKDNVKALRAFWLDIDCGPTKTVVNEKTGRPAGYATQADAIAALDVLCLAVGLPPPVLVNSGRGLHVYWPMERDLERWEWEPVAARLRDVCGEQGVFVDPAVFEVARILRIPGTFNFKDDPPSAVTVIRTASTSNFETFRDLLGVAPTAAPAPAKPKRELTALGKSLRDNEISVFKKIMIRSAQGTGCPQLQDCYETQATLPEPRWFDALSIAKFCSDAESAMQRMSDKHPDYDPDKTLEKTRHILGPHTCATFDRNNPGGCKGCPHFRKIKSPIMLGRDIREATDAEYIIGEEETYVIPKYPFPYFRGANGGVYIRGADEESDPLLVYEQDIYVLKRMHDPGQGDVVVIRAHMPQDGVREFVVPNIVIADMAELRRKLASFGVITHGRRFELLAGYIIACTKDLQTQRKAEKMRTQFGWADNYTKFIAGDREITVDGIFHSPPSTATQALAAHIGPVGTLDKWKEVWALYGRPGLEGSAFGALTGFGSMLFHLFGQQGAIVNLIHPNSGTGKTTILHMANSIWGNPDRMCVIAKDTINSKMARLGVFNNMCYTVDEVTNMKAEEFSDLAYAITQGRFKDRMKASANELRLNSTTWCTMGLFSSNASFVEKLQALKANPDGEVMRLMEYKIDYSDAIDPALGKDMFDQQLSENYGHAGPIFVDYVLRNWDDVRTLCLSIQSKLDLELGLTQKERFRSAQLAANLSALRIIRHLGLVDWNMKPIYDFACRLVTDLRRDVPVGVHADAMGVLGDYINRHLQNILVVKEHVDARSNMPSLPQLEPRGELLIRYEPDTKRMFLSARAFKNDCVMTQVNYKETLLELELTGVLQPAMLKRMSKGMKVNSPPVYCLVLDCSGSGFVEFEEAMGVVAPEAEGENNDA